MRWCLFFSGLALLELTASTAAAQKLFGIPTLKYQSVEKGSFDLSMITRVVVDKAVSEVSDKDGATLLAPTLMEFAATFAADLTEALGREIPVAEASESSVHEVFLTLSDTKSFRDAAGYPTSEGYKLHVAKHTLQIVGASPLGVWWATRSILQQLALRQNLLAGLILDAPGWGTRGIMLDAGRHYYPPEFLIETCAYLSFFKQNTLHLHLSDNVLNLSPPTSESQLNDSYAAFRLSSDDINLVGLARQSNESYTRDQFDFIQRRCAARGVTIIPEIEAPAHALPIVRWQPQLGLADDLTKLNISHPETIPVMKLIWSTFLPWIYSKVVHVGADEYSNSSMLESQVISDYTRLVNELSSFIKERSGKSVRIWGTFPPSRGAAIDKTVSIQHWSFNETNPVSDFVTNGYKVINSDDMFYMVGKVRVQYGTELNLTRVFHGTPDGSAWAPNVFDAKNASNNARRDSSALLGHIAAFWNDFGPNATTYSEAYYALRNGLPALADKQWGGTLFKDEYASILPTLQAAIPGQNLDRRVASVGDELLNYDLSSKHSFYIQDIKTTIIKDDSGNGYNATTNCKVGSTLLLRQGCVMDTPLHSKGRNYTLTFTIKMSAVVRGPLFTGADSQLHLEPGQTTLISGANGYSVNYGFPIGAWVEASLVGAGDRTFLKITNGSTYEFLADIGLYGVQKRTAPIAIEAPLAQIGGGNYSGQIKSLVLSSKAT